MTDAMTLLSQGDLLGALNYVYSNVIPYGFFWMLMGIVVFALTYSKTKSYSISTVIFIPFSGLTSTLIPKEIQMYFLLLIGVMLTAMFVKMIIEVR